MSIAHIIRYYPASINIDTIDLDSEFLHQLSPTERLKDIVQVSIFDLVALVLSEMQDNELAIWFQGKHAAGMLGTTDSSFAPLEKNTKVSEFSVLTAVRKKSEFELNNVITMVLPASAASASVENLRKLKPIATAAFIDVPNAPSYKSLFNRYIASSKANCMITIQGTKDTGFEIVDKLHWDSTDSHFGIVLNAGNKELWQVSVLTHRALLACKAIDLTLGSLLSKSQAATIYSRAAATRYFQVLPSSSAIDAVKSKAVISDTAIILVLWRPAGLNNYTVLDPTAFDL